MPKNNPILKIIFPAVILFTLYITVMLSIKVNKPYDFFNVLGKNHPVAKEYTEYLESFDDENGVYVLGLSENIITEGDRLSKLLKEIETPLIRTKGIEKVRSLSSLNYLTLKEQKLKIRDFIVNGQLTKEGERRLIETLFFDKPIWRKTKKLF